MTIGDVVIAADADGHYPDVLDSFDPHTGALLRTASSPYVLGPLSAGDGRIVAGPNVFDFTTGAFLRRLNLYDGLGVLSFTFPTAVTNGHIALVAPDFRAS